MENIQTILETKKSWLKNWHFGTYVLPACILGICFIIGTVIAGTVMYKIRALDNIIAVSGSTREKVISDSAKLTIRIEKQTVASNITSGYQEITQKSQSIIDYLVKGGIPATGAITTGQLASFQEYSQDSQIEKKYNISQTITVTSADVYLLDKLAKEVPLQSTNTMIVNVQLLEFFYTKLPEIRVSLIGKAIEDAKERAKSLTFGGTVGKLKSAGTGVTQVVPVNSTDISDYGTYDTSTIEKEIVVTVKASFVVK